MIDRLLELTQLRGELGDVGADLLGLAVTCVDLVSSQARIPRGPRTRRRTRRRSFGMVQNRPKADTAIGSAARTAIDHLRGRL